MAAYVVLIEDEEEWETIQLLLSRIEGGAILVPPQTCKALRKIHDNLVVDEFDGELINYDFGGEPDILLDVADKLDHLGILAILEHFHLTEE